MKLKYILFALLTLTLSQSRAQAPTWAWAQTIISNQGAQNQASPIINGMITDNSGNIYITGFFYDSLRMGKTLLIGQGETNMFLAKYSANGIVQWATQNNGDKNTAAIGNGICLDNNGNLYICGGITDTVQFDNFYIDSKGEKMFMASYNPMTGKCENVRQIGHAFYNFPFDTANTGTLYKIFIDKSGNIYLSGYAVSNNVVDFGGQGISGTFVVKYDQNFNLDWINSVTNAGAARSLLIDSVGDAFSVGNFTDSISCDYNELKSYSYYDNSYLVSYNNTKYGNLNWFKSIGGNPYTYSATSNNGSFIYLNGGFEDSCIFDSLLFFIGNSIYGIYGFLAKYDWAGNILWAKMLSNTYPASVDDKNGNTINCGNFRDSVQIGNDKISAPGNNLFAVKLDGNGNLLWAEHDSISASISQNLLQPYLSTIDSAGNVIVAMLYPNVYISNKKDSLNFVLGGDTVKAKANYGNIILAKLGNAPTGISLPKLPEAGIKLFPNPSDGQFTVDIPKPFSLNNIEVYNIVGQECNATVNYSQDKFKATVTMDNAAAGVYTVILSSGTSKVAKLFVKQ